MGGGEINIERWYTNPVSSSPAAGRYDLLQTAIHEIGHALGMSSANLAYRDETGDGSIDVGLPLPSAGSIIPVEDSHAHLPDELGQTLMWGGGLPRNQRRYPSSVDILANAQVSQFTDVNIEPPIEGSTGSIFSNPNPNCPPAACTGMGTNSITWGIPSRTTGLPNSLSIAGGSFAGSLGSPFVAGTINYFNGSVLVGSSISEVDLSLSTLVDIPTLGIAGLSVDDSRKVTINNTLNTSDPIASADFLSIAPPSGASSIFGNHFHVLEGESATAELMAQIVLQDAIDGGDGDTLPLSGLGSSQSSGGDPDPLSSGFVPTSHASPQKFVLQLLGFGDVVDGRGFVTATSVPEPTSVAGLGFALGLGALSLRRKTKV